MNFAIIGLGYISTRHLKAIKDVGGTLIAAVDRDERTFSKLNGYPTQVKTFESIGDLFSDPVFEDVEYVSICTPNDIHVAEANFFLINNKKVICEKPMANSLEVAKRLKDDPNFNCNTQLRYADVVKQIKEKYIDTMPKHIDLNVAVHRGAWYDDSWKMDEKRSGGLLYNIGVHYFDIIGYLFGWECQKSMKKVGSRNALGSYFIGNISVAWSLSIDAKENEQHKTFKIDNVEYDLLKQFDELHTLVYKDVVQGGGIKASEAIKALELINKL